MRKNPKKKLLGRILMKPRGWMFLRVLINRYHQGSADNLMQLLPEGEAQLTLNQNIQSSELSPLLNHGQEILEKLHYSWFQPFIEKLSTSLQPFFLACLPKKQAEALQRSIDKNMRVPNLAETFKPYFLQRLYSSLNAEDRLPIDYLPETPLSPLARWSKEGLVELINFLGLHDLSVEIRHVVAKQALKNIYDCLSPKQMQYLKICLHQKEQVVSPPLNLNFNQLNCPQLLKDLHKRGLMRLGKAISGQHPDLTWYLSHILDTGRGSLLTQYYNPQPYPKITQPLTLQVISLMNFLKKSNA